MHQQTTVLVTGNAPGRQSARCVASDLHISYGQYTMVNAVCICRAVSWGLMHVESNSNLQSLNYDLKPIHGWK